MGDGLRKGIDIAISPFGIISQHFKMPILDMGGHNRGHRWFDGIVGARADPPGKEG